MINRRTLLFGTAGIALTSVLTGCQSAAQEAFRVLLLEGAVPSEVLQKFKQQADNTVRFQSATQISDIFQQLQKWQKPPKDAASSIRHFLPWAQTEAEPQPDDLVSIGDYWLESAIAQNLIEPLSIPASSLEQLPISWQRFSNRDSQGLVEGLANSPSSSEPLSDPLSEPSAPKISLWAAPYKVQSMVIVYRKSAFPQTSANGTPFASWQDLLQPQLSGSIALPDHPRLVIGLAHKIQSDSFNAVIEGAVIEDAVIEGQAGGANRSAKINGQIVATLNQLNQQVKTYSSENPLKALVNEDVKAVVCWSGDAVAATKRYRDLRIAIPQEGSLLSADMWVRPKGSRQEATATAAAQRWIDFCWQAGPATQISVSGEGISPIFLTAGVRLPETLANHLLSAEVISNSEPLLPIPAQLKTAYLDLWQQIRET